MPMINGDSQVPLGSKETLLRLSDGDTLAVDCAMELHLTDARSAKSMDSGTVRSVAADNIDDARVRAVTKLFDLLDRSIDVEPPANLTQRTMLRIEASGTRPGISSSVATRRSGEAAYNAANSINAANPGSLNTPSKSPVKPPIIAGKNSPQPLTIQA